MTRKELQQRLEAPISESSTISLRLFISGLVATATVVGAYTDLRVQVHSQNKMLEQIIVKMEKMAETSWTKQDDLHFMSDFADRNNLVMLRHNGEE